MALAQWQEAQTNVAAGATEFVLHENFCARATAASRARPSRRAIILQAGQQIMSIVPADVWVVANFKESQLKNMQPGQPVTVAIDALGGREFAAHVDSVQAGSGAQFSLLPPENATGNYVKVVQRVPVKIVFDEPLPADHVIGPGLSVTPSVQVSKFVFPAWAIALIARIFRRHTHIGFPFHLSRWAQIGPRERNRCTDVGQSRSEDPLLIINDVIVGVQRTKAKLFVEVDRQKAIEVALDEARSGDIVLLAGKGHETYQVLRDRTIEFDDREVATAVLRHRGFGSD